MSALRTILDTMEAPVITTVLVQATINFATNDASNELEKEKSVIVRLTPYWPGALALVYYGVKFTVHHYCPKKTGFPDPRTGLANPGGLANDSCQLVPTEEIDSKLIQVIAYTIKCARSNPDQFEELCELASAANSSRAEPTSSGAPAQLPDLSPQLTSSSSARLGSSSQAPGQLVDSSLVPLGRECAQKASSSAQLVFAALPSRASSSSRAQMASSSAHMVLTIETEDPEDPVTDVKEKFLPEDEARGSKLLYKRVELGPQTGEAEIDNSRLQMIESMELESMELARRKDKDCTLQLGSFAVLRYTDLGPKWWKIPKHLTPTIYGIERSPWSLLDLLPGKSVKWTIRGINLQSATLKATTREKSEDLEVLHCYKTRSGEDVIVCKETQLVWKSAPIFPDKVYICASRVAEVEMGKDIKLQSEVKNVKRAYWHSVVRGVMPGLQTIAMYFLWGEMMRSSFGQQNGLFAKVAIAYVDDQYGHNVVGLYSEWSKIISSILRDFCTFLLIHIFIMVTSIFVLTLWRLYESVSGDEKVVMSAFSDSTNPCPPNPYPGVPEDIVALKVKDDHREEKISGDEKVDMAASSKSTNPRPPNPYPGVSKDIVALKVKDDHREENISGDEKVVMSASSKSTNPRPPNPYPGVSKDKFKRAQLNDSVWELYSPNGNPELEIIFFHGLQVKDLEDAFWKTWLARDDETVIWPKEWLIEHFPQARILTVSYNANPKETGDPVGLLAKNLITDIIKSRKLNIGQDCPVFLVGHCLGGIVIKKFILEAIERKDLLKKPSPNISEWKVEDNKVDEAEQSQLTAYIEEIERVSKFLDNVSGAFFYSTPHRGSHDELTELVQKVTSTSPILGLLKVLDSERDRINDEFRRQRIDKNLNANTYGVTESLPTETLGFNKQVVEEASARWDVDNCYTIARADHFTVCRARSKRDSVFTRLANFITYGLQAGGITLAQDARKEAALPL